MTKLIRKFTQLYLVLKITFTYMEDHLFVSGSLTTGINISTFKQSIINYYTYATLCIVFAIFYSWYEIQKYSFRWYVQVTSEKRVQIFLWYIWSVLNLSNWNLSIILQKMAEETLKYLLLQLLRRALKSDKEVNLNIGSISHSWNFHCKKIIFFTNKWQKV